MLGRHVAERDLGWVDTLGGVDVKRRLNLCALDLSRWMKANERESQNGLGGRVEDLIGKVEIRQPDVSVLPE